jgi:signal transduction histidine kinase
MKEDRDAKAAFGQTEAFERRSIFPTETRSASAGKVWDYERTLNIIRKLAIPAFADWCFVYLPLVSEGIRSALLTPVDGRKEQSDQQADMPPMDLLSDALHAVRVFRTGTSELLTDVEDSELRTTAGDHAQYEALKRLGLRSAAVVPIPGHYAPIGVIGFASSQSNRYTPADLVFAEDLGWRISLALENARLYREAQEANRAKDEFLATLSHELRTPLHAIVGWIQILRSKRLDELTTARAYEAIERNAKMQTELIESMLDVSRMITGRIRLEFQPALLTEAVEEALECLRPAAEAKGVRVECDLTPKRRSISGDPFRLRQIVWNLVSNAVKFTPAGGLVEIKLEYTDSEARLTVRDTGRGIDPQFLPHIFDRFRQAETMASRTASGLGLGLSIVRHLVELHGGVIEASSEGEGRGATFAVTLPFRERISASVAS